MQTAEERRAADEQAALEKAFVQGTLPEVDRRSEVPIIDPKPPTIDLPDTPSADAQPPHYGVTKQQYRRASFLVQQIGLTIPNHELEHWDQLLTIWGYR